MFERIQKIIAHAGVASRRHAEKLIEEERVTVNGETSQLGDKANSADRIEVDGVPINSKERPVYFMLNKPRGVVSTAKDDKQRQSVVALLSDIKERIYPIGRLDYDTTGLLLLTNDGELAHRLTHPSYGVEKTYLAKVEGKPTPGDLTRLAEGVVINYHKTAPAKVKPIRYDPKKRTSMLEITIHEGQNHQVKNMLSEVGLPVIKLNRPRYAGLDLTGLTVGEYRSLTQREIKQLKKLVDLN